MTKLLQTERVELTMRSKGKSKTLSFENKEKEIYSDSFGMPEEGAAYERFLTEFPLFKETLMVDSIREHEYCDLKHVCLDYKGIGLFSHSQISTLDFALSAEYVSGNLATQAMYVEEGTVEKEMRKMILRYMNIDPEDYYIAFTANLLAAFRLVGESYPFHRARRLLLAYDEQTEMIDSMSSCARSNGADVIEAPLTRPSFQVDADRIRKVLSTKRSKSTDDVSQGLFVYPIVSSLTGSRNSVRWIKEAKENGWHVLLDVSSISAKGMDSLGLTFFRPDLIVCSFYKAFGFDPTGFGCLFLNKNMIRILGDSRTARAIGMVRIVHHSDSSNQIRSRFHCPKEIAGEKMENSILKCTSNNFNREQCPGTSQSKETNRNKLILEPNHIEGDFQYVLNARASAAPKIRSLRSSGLRIYGSAGEDYEFIFPVKRHAQNVSPFPFPCSKSCSRALMKSASCSAPNTPRGSELDCRIDVEEKSLIRCKGLEQADEIGLAITNLRHGALMRWLVKSLQKLRHSKNGNPRLVNVYGPPYESNRGPSIAFNIVDCLGNIVDPKRVQRLADRSSISLDVGVVQGMINFENNQVSISDGTSSNRKESPDSAIESKQVVQIPVVCASLGFVSNFSDVFKLWVFVAKFLDGEFVIQELWQYFSLNQETILL